MIYKIRVDGVDIATTDIESHCSQSHRDYIKACIGDILCISDRHIRLVPENQNSHLKGKLYQDTLSGRIYFDRQEEKL